MIGKLSGSSAKAIDAAKALARRLDHGKTGSGHVLVGLSLNPDVSSQILSPQGVTTGNLRRQVMETVSANEDARDFPFHEFPLTGELYSVLVEASKVAVARGNECVWPEHLLLAITTTRCEGYRVLVRCGGDPEQVAKLAIESLNNLPLTKEAMNLDITDTSVGVQHLAHQITRTARVLVPRDHQPGREVVLQAIVINAPLEKDSKAAVSVLNDQFAWTELLALPVSEWRPQVPLPDRNDGVDVDKLTDLADSLLARAVRILAA